MSVMDDLQWTLVAARIDDLRRERDAIRAEAARDQLNTRSEGGDSRTATHDETSRVRLGHWLMALGNRIAGPRRIADMPARRSPKAAGTDPCGDGERLAPAA